jgi:STE24 endopeptidase
MFGEHPKAQALWRARKAVRVVGALLSLAVTLALALRLAWPLAEAVAALTSSPWLRALLFSAAASAPYFVARLPLSFIEGFLIEKRFGLSTQSFGGWVGDLLKGLAVAIVLGAIMVLGVTAAVIWAGNAWWWVAALGAAVFGVLLTRVAPQILVPLFFKMKPLDSPELKRRLPDLPIFVIDMSRRTKAANAAVIGFGSTRRAVVGDTLLADFTPDEIEFVLAHELGHHRNHDLWIGVASGSVLTFLALAAADMAVRGVGAGMGLGFPPTGDNFNPIVLFWAAVAVRLFEAVTAPLSRWLSRRLEARADLFAVGMTGKPKSGADAFRKLGYQNLARFRPPRWEEILFYTHPCLAHRIKVLEAPWSSPSSASRR